MWTRIARILALAGIVGILVSMGLRPAPAQVSNTAALSGQVSSTEEGQMEGVLVSAKKAGSTVTVTVASDAKGHYSFPRNRLEPGQYALRIRATGYDLEGPGTVDIAANKTASLGLKLRKTADLAAQLTTAEWVMSVPGTEQQKNMLTCSVGCHTAERIVRSHYDADGFMKIFELMSSFGNGSIPGHIQKRAAARMEPDLAPERQRGRAEFLSTVNLSKVPKWEYTLKTLPRPTGRGTHVIITEYDLPRPYSQPHDVVVDREGLVWYGDFGEDYLGRLDPKTGKATEFPIPELKPGWPHGNLTVDLDKDQNIWMGLMVQGAAAKFDRKTQKFQTWTMHNSDVTQVAMVMVRNSQVDGKVWTNNVGHRAIHRLDLKTGEIEMFDPYRDYKNPQDTRVHSVYGLSSDSHNNLYWNDIAGEFIGKIDAKSGKISLFPTPTRNSNPRRGAMDEQDRLWFAEYRAGKIAMFDTKTEQFQEWAIPTPWSGPYDAVRAGNGEVWSSGMSTDRVWRLDPKTGQFVVYLLPRDTNVRRVFTDNSTTPPTFWVGSNHGSSIVKVEALD